MANHAKIITDKVIDAVEVTTFFEQINQQILSGIFNISYDEVKKQWTISYGEDDDHIEMICWIANDEDYDESNELVIKSVNTCVEFRHGHYFQFMWWVEGVFRENLGQHLNGQMWDDGTGFIGAATPERFETFEKYIVGDETDLTIIGRRKEIKFGWQQDEVPQELIDELNLDFKI